MQFTTQINISKSSCPIDYHSKIVSLGSCFAVNMAQKLDYFKFQNVCNPFGILFHPLAIEKIINFAVSQNQFTEADIFYHNERWHSFDSHSDLSTSSNEEIITVLNDATRSTLQHLLEASHIIITYGTSWVYSNIETNEIVANCHKIPQKQFIKKLLPIEEIHRSIENTIQLILSVNPKANIIFTVSPVRHLKDGFVENQQSKSHLIAALHTVLQTELLPQFAIARVCKLNTEYFPSYELMMDELRDYRFYAEDMIHPNSVAIDYIWQRFSETHIASECYSIMDEVETIQKGLAHRSFNPNSDSHQLFLSKLQDKIERIQKKFPLIQF